VLTWFAVALAGGAVAVAAGWSLRRLDELGRPRRFPWVSVSRCWSWPWPRPSPGGAPGPPGTLPRRAASVLAGARVAVRRQSFGGAFVDAGPQLGYVRWRADGKPEPWTLIKRDQCRHLAAHARSDKRRPSREQVVAVHVLTHEAMHLSGRLNEAAAKCAAVQRDAHTARLLGAPDAAAALDERLADAPWLARMSSSLFDTRSARSRPTLKGALSCSEQCCSASSPA
jgi:hypothetical protein